MAADNDLPGISALILVDIQNDFLPGGALAVPNGDEVVAVANLLMPFFPLVVATQDWHPAEHHSFASRHEGRAVGHVVELDGLSQILWPDHCIVDSSGAEFAPGLDASRIHRVFRKGIDRYIDSYSGFFDNGHKRDTGLGTFLRERHVDDVYVMGLATEYCVKFTALDAVGLGFTVHLVEDGCRGVNLAPHDVSNALAEMANAGVHIVASEHISNQRI